MVRQGAAILLVDTLKSNSSRLSQLLTNSGYRVRSAHDLEAARAAIAGDSAPDLVIHDVSLPRSWAEVVEEHEALRHIVDEKCAVLVYGDREAEELAELEWACRAAAHARTDEDGAALLHALSFVGLPRPTPSMRPQPASALRPSARRLLLVDASDLARDLVLPALHEAGFEVDVADSLAAAIAQIAKTRPDAIVADLLLFESGAEDARSALRSVGVVLLLASSAPDAEVAHKARTHRVDGWVTKTRGVAAFAAAVSRAINEDRTSDQRAS
jgi:CheY-like chemotaxis protein